MTDCNEPPCFFQDLAKRKVEVDFGGGYLSSDGGGLILRELERHSGLFRALADCFVDHRDPRYVEHRLETLLARAHSRLGFGVRRPQRS
jgi:Transposase DDE domain group 1